MRLGQIYGFVWPLVDMDPQVILNLSFVRQFVVDFEGLYELVNGKVLFGYNDAVIDVNHKNYIFFCVNTLIHFGLCESNV